jgi:PQQ-dependent catabolism-associated CXXCW motif protein
MAAFHRLRRYGAVSVFVALLIAAAHARAEAPGEPDGYRMQDYRAPTPATLGGAATVSTAEARTLWEAHAAVFVDVMPRPPKPKGLPEGTLWRDPRRDGIPGSLWLPNVGYGGLNPEVDRYFRDNLARATRGDRAAPLLFYCLAECWMSWNAAKRALEYGYTRVYWYPAGSDGWTAAGWPLEDLQPQPLPQ